jgi:crossover junction endodeoxyribonuclease RuvC
VTVVGVDLSLTCTGLSDGRETWTVLSRGHRGDVLDRRWQRIASIAAQVASITGDAAAGLVVVEGPSLGSRGGSAWDRAGLWWQVLGRLCDAEVPVAVVPPSARAKYATGKGNADKAAVTSAATHRAGRVFATSDEADAWWLAAMGYDHLGEQLVAVPAVNRAALAKVEWPVAQSSDRSVTAAGVRQEWVEVQ